MAPLRLGALPDSLVMVQLTSSAHSLNSKAQTFAPSCHLTPKKRKNTFSGADSSSIWKGSLCTDDFKEGSFRFRANAIREGNSQHRMPGELQPDCQVKASDACKVESNPGGSKSDRVVNGAEYRPITAGRRAADSLFSWMKAGGRVSREKSKSIEDNVAAESNVREITAGMFEEAVVTKEETVVYEIKRKDWVYNVATKLGVHIDEIRELNPGIDLDRVKPKQKILVPKRVKDQDADVWTTGPTVSSASSPTFLETKPSPEYCPMLSAPPSSSKAVDSCATPPNELPAVDVSEVAKKGGTDLGGMIRARPNGDKIIGVDSNRVSYTVRRGDRVASILNEWGITESELQSLNPRLDLSKIHASQVITLPRLKNRAKSTMPSGKNGYYDTFDEVASERSRNSASSEASLENGGFREYIIRPGDYLYDVAEEFGVDVEDLIAVNSLSEDEPIRVGQVVNIPLRKQDIAPDCFQASQGESSFFPREISSWTLGGLVLLAGVVSIVVGGTLVMLKRRREASQNTNAGPASTNHSAKNSQKMRAWDIQDGSNSVHLSRLQQPTGANRMLRKGLGQEYLRLVSLEGEFPITRDFSPRKDGGAFPSATGMAEVMKFASFTRETDAVGEVAGGHGFAVRASLSDALLEAARSATVDLEVKPPTLALVAVGSSYATDEEGLEGQGADAVAEVGKPDNILEDGIQVLLEELPESCILHGVAPEWSARRPAEGSVVAAGAVLLVQAKGGVFSVAVPVEGRNVEAAVRKAAEGLTAQVGPRNVLKAVVACVSQGQESTVLDELALCFPSASLYSVSGQPGVAAPAWLVPSKASPSASLGLGISLLGLTKQADVPGAYMATVIGQWLHRHQHLVVARPPKSVRKS